MRRRIVIVLVAALVFGFVPARASSGVTCEGIAPLNFHCEDSFVIESNRLDVGVSMGHGPGFGFTGTLRATFSGESGTESIECVSGLFGSPASCAFSAPVRWQVGEIVSLAVDVVGVGSWRVTGDSG